MSTTTLSSSPSRGLPADKILAGIALVIGLATIAGAWGSQLIGGLVPCELCWAERTPYYWGLAVLALTLVLWNRLPLTVWYVAMAIVAAIFVWSTYLGVYHSGVEWLWWPGPTACTGTGGDLDFNSLATGNIEQVVPCDAVQFRLFGLSLAGYNALISALIVVLVVAAMLIQMRGRRAT